MSKLSRENVGKTFECSNDEENLIIYYIITNESFDHEFGTQRQYSYEIESVKQYLPDVDKWEELSDELYSKSEKIIDRLVEKDL